jgi:hypothetical protein
VFQLGPLVWAVVSSARSHIFSPIVAAHNRQVGPWSGVTQTRPLCPDTPKPIGVQNETIRQEYDNFGYPERG